MLGPTEALYGVHYGSCGLSCSIVLYLYEGRERHLLSSSSTPYRADCVRCDPLHTQVSPAPDRHSGREIRKYLHFSRVCTVGRRRSLQSSTELRGEVSKVPFQSKNFKQFRTNAPSGHSITKSLVAQASSGFRAKIFRSVSSSVEIAWMPLS